MHQSSIPKSSRHIIEVSQNFYLDRSLFWVALGNLIDRNDGSYSFDYPVGPSASFVLAQWYSLLFYIYILEARVYAPNLSNNYLYL